MIKTDTERAEIWNPANVPEIFGEQQPWSPHDVIFWEAVGTWGSTLPDYLNSAISIILVLQ